MAEPKKKKPAENASKDVPAPAVKRTGLVQFVREVRRETSKVTWPTWKETWLTTVMVFIMVGLTMVFFFAVDWALALGERFLIGAVS
ncbi:MAG: preprotein translocase subunit SecE [Alphaproteobacteria bacterium]|nr:preprotein translocase subunit SecE [Alphaproteobacteria bacterium]MDE2013479.1 preprotein translocase subunit SecE [Alphaproteobacteria bacterium]MDE2072637.1 preprotein translocase subunit SecE [Alphaproteobacteria bacterium]MDE2350330.1 preprotein translocase subunit SecE [Alphaproteobacteria bacterium]